MAQYTVVITTRMTNRGGSNLRNHVMTLKVDAESQSDAKKFALVEFDLEYPFKGVNITVFDSIIVNPPN